MFCILYISRSSSNIWTSFISLSFSFVSYLRLSFLSMLSAFNPQSSSIASLSNVFCFLYISRSSSNIFREVLSVYLSPSSLSQSFLSINAFRFQSLILFYRIFVKCVQLFVYFKSLVKYIQTSFISLSFSFVSYLRLSLSMAFFFQSIIIFCRSSSFLSSTFFSYNFQ